jgi:hypothetical protein
MRFLIFRMAGLVHKLLINTLQLTLNSLAEYLRSYQDSMTCGH